METAVLSLQGLYDKLRMQVDLLNENVEPSEYFMVLGFIFITHHLRQMPEVPIQMPATFLLYVHPVSQISSRWHKTLMTVVANG